MGVYLKYLFLFLIIFAVFSIPLDAQNMRVVPLDMFLIVDASESLENTRNEVISWVNQRIIDQILMDGDRITVWSAGERAEILYSATISGETSKNELRERLRAMETRGSRADFESALRELEGRLPGTAQNRISYSMLITASAEGLAHVLSGPARSLLRYSRSERSEGWQAYVFAPDIGPRVQLAARLYMEAQR